MFHSIITILTTAAVALHAMLGCCAHHDHSCQSHESGLHESGLAAVVQHAHDHSSHAHHHHHDDDESSNEDAAAAGKDCGHEHDGGQSHRCAEGECSFTSVQRSDDLEFMLNFSMWFQALSDVADADAFDSLLALHSAAESPPDPISISGSGHAKLQVWRL